MSGYFIGTSVVINSDSAYVHESFSVVGLSTLENMKITASDAAIGNYFGRSVAVGSGRIIIGSPFDEDKGPISGSAYIYSTPQVITLYDVIDSKYL